MLRCWGEGGEMHELGVAGSDLCPLFSRVETSSLSPGEICGHPISTCSHSSAFGALNPKKEVLA